MLFLCLRMKKLLFFCFLPLLAEAQVSNQNVNIEPKGKWYFGAELGLNSIPSFANNGTKHSFQGGLTAEYYFAKQWSAIGRIKYFKTGVSFVEDEANGIFDGAVVSVPVDLKWEFTIHKNLKGNLKLGAAYNHEIKSDYRFPEGKETDFSKSFFSMNSGAGISYFVSPKMAFYIDLEAYRLGGYKGNTGGIMGNNYYTDNNHFNLGVKYNFN